MATLDEHRYVDFEDAVKFNLQQKESKLLKIVDTTTNKGKMQSHDFLGEVGNFDPNTGRHSNTKLTEVDHNRRWINCIEHNKAFLIDRKDQARNLHSLESNYVKAATMAYNRTIDAIIYEGLDKAVLAGESGSTSIKRPTANDIAVAGYYDANGVWQTTGGSTGLTIDKLRRAKLMLDENYADEVGKYFMIVHPRMLDQMLGHVEVKSADYNTVKALVNGEINTFMGFEFISYNGVKENSGVYDCYAVCQNAMMLASQESTGTLQTFLNTRPDKNMSKQIFMAFDKGVARMYDEGVIKVPCEG